MDLGDREKMHLLNQAVDIVKALSDSQNMPFGSIPEFMPRLLEVVYDKLLDLAKKALSNSL